MKMRGMRRITRRTLLMILTGLTLLTSLSQAGNQKSRRRGFQKSWPFPTTLEPRQAPSAPEAVAALADVLKGNVIRVDVAENGNRFTFDEDPVFPEDGLPAFGNEFITEGFIYPYGTLDGTNGVNPNGTPEFPDKVIGRWTCRGWHVGDGAHTETGPWVATQQLFDFGAKPGRTTLTTDGLELPDVNVPIQRAVTGGTGVLSGARGEQAQTFLGWNQSIGTNSRHEFKPSLK